MPTQPSYSSDFSVPPNPQADGGITEDMLPPVPSRPLPVTAAAVLLGLFGLALVVGALWRLIEILTEPDSSDFGRSVVSSLLPLVYGLLFTVAVVALLRLVWLGSTVGSVLTMLLAGYVTLLAGIVVVKLLSTLAAGGDPGSVVEPHFGDPARIALTIGAGTVVPLPILLLLPVSWRFSRKAGMIRQIRGFIRKGRPVTRLPQQLFD